MSPKRIKKFLKFCKDNNNLSIKQSDLATRLKKEYELQEELKSR